VSNNPLQATLSTRKTGAWPARLSFSLGHNYGEIMWVCLNCKTEIEEEIFDACWKCLTPRGEKAPPDKPSNQPRNQKPHISTKELISIIIVVSLVIPIGKNFLLTHDVSLLGILIPAIITLWLINRKR
jgi:hypothetical protein